MKRLLSLLLIFTLVGCATKDPEPKTTTGKAMEFCGVEQRQKNVFNVTCGGSDFEVPSDTKQWAKYRSAILTNEQDYDYFVVLDRFTKTVTRQYSRGYYDPRQEIYKSNKYVTNKPLTSYQVELRNGKPESEDAIVPKDVLD